MELNQKGSPPCALRYVDVLTSDLPKIGDVQGFAFRDTNERRSSSIHMPSPGFREADNSEDHISGLVEEIAMFMLDDSEITGNLNDSHSLSASSRGPQMPLSGSPQSTLAELTTWDLSSSGGSSSGNISSGVTSPTTPSVETPHTRADDDTMYLLYSELLRLKVEEEIKVREQQLMQLKQQQHYQQLMWKMRQAQLSSLMTDKMEPPNYEHEFVQYPSVQNSSTQQPASCTSEHYRSDVRSRSDFSQKHGLGREYEHLRLQNARINVPQRNWEQCSLRGDVHQPNPQYNVARMHNLHGGQYNGYKTQQTNRSGLRAVFLGIPGARGSEGTGVFLPRRVGGCSESKRRPACSTVLLPSRIVQALKLNVEDTLVCPSNPRSASFPKPDISTSSVRVRSSPVCTDAVSGPEEWSLHTAGAGNSVCSSLQEVAPNVCLPTEWTY